MNRVVKLVLVASVILSLVYYVINYPVSVRSVEYGQESQEDPRKIRGGVTELPETTVELQYNLVRLMQNGSWPMHYIKQLSNSKVAEVARLFNVTGLCPYCDSLQRQFFHCPAKHIISNHRFVQGKGVITKHYQSCKKMAFKKQSGVVGLVSFPGSGNSWVRQLLETSTGVYTGSVYCDQSYIDAGMLGEGIRSRYVIAVKTHHCAHSGFSKVIYVVRNPFGAILAEFTRLVNKHSNASTSHVAGLGAKHFSNTSVKWHNQVDKKARYWLRHITDCLKSSPIPVIVVKYENLKSNLYGELQRILDFLNYPYTDEDLQCTVNYTNDNFHRKHNSTFDPYSPEQKQTVFNSIKAANEILRQYNIVYDLI